MSAHNETVQDLTTLYARLANLLIKKNDDYSPAGIHEAGMQGVLTRLRDKLNRAERLYAAATPANFEALEDTLDDLIGYSTIARMLWEDKWFRTTSENRETCQVIAAPVRLALSKSVYLAGPIDAAGASEMALASETTWQDEATSAMIRYGLVAFNPKDAVINPKSDFDAMERMNWAMMDGCDFVIAYLPKDVASVGTVMEVLKAVEKGKNVCYVSQVEFSYMRHLKRFTSFDLAANWVRQTAEATTNLF